MLSVRSVQIKSHQFHALDRSEIPEPYNCGVGFYTISVNPQEYIPWLKSELLFRGVSFERREVKSLAELWPLVGPKGVLVNATSLGTLHSCGIVSLFLVVTVTS